jgi:hypothetical protein
MSLNRQVQARKSFWWALLSLPLTALAFVLVFAFRDDLPENWVDGILIGLPLIFLGGFILVIWTLLFRRSRTKFPRWSIAAGLLSLVLVLALVIAPLGRWSKSEAPVPSASESTLRPPALVPTSQDPASRPPLQHPASSPTSRPPAPGSISLPPALGSSESPHSHELTVDVLLASMSTAPIAFNVPKAMQLEDTAEVKLILGPGHDLKELIATLNKDAEGANIRITDRMEAHLSGTGFKIIPVTPELQAVSRADLTSWQWDVKATEKGHHLLHLTLTAVFDLGGSLTPRAMKTFDRTIEVNVTVGKRIADFGHDNWQWLWATLLVPVGGWFLKKRAGGRRLTRVERVSRAAGTNHEMSRRPSRR